MSQPDMFAANKSSTTAPKSSEDQKEEEVPEALKRWMVRRDRLAQIPLPEVLEALGGRMVPRDRSKWKIDGIGVFPIKGQKWLNGNANIPGFGAVQLVKNVMDLKDTPAMQWLAERFPHVLDSDWVAPEQEEEKEVGFSPPPRADEELPQIRDYLVGRRGLPEELVDAEIKAGRIYATDFRSKDDETGQWSSDYRAVFVGPSSAELRSIQSDGFKGCCPGSDSERSGYQVMFRGESDGRLGIVEAAIDALSYNAMHPQRYCYSTNGSGRFHLQYRLTLEAFRNGFHTDLALDADHAGDLAAQMIFNALFLRDYLSKKAEVAPERIDEWILTNKITMQALESPHLLFFSHPPTEGNDLWAVKERQKNPDKNAPLEERTILVDVDRVEPPTVSFRLARTSNGLKAGKYDVPITPEIIREISEKYRTVRDRPVLGKDWNEVWKKMVLKEEARAKEAREQAKQAPAAPAVEEPVATGRFIRRPR